MALQRGQLRFDFGESSGERLAADRAGGTLVEDAFALEFERLALQLASGCSGAAGFIGFGFGHLLRSALLDLLFDRFAFPSSGHSYRVQVAGYRLQVTGCRLQGTGCRLQGAGWEALAARGNPRAVLCTHESLAPFFVWH